MPGPAGGVAAWLASRAGGVSQVRQLATLSDRDLELLLETLEKRIRGWIAAGEFEQAVALLDEYLAAYEESGRRFRAWTARRPRGEALRADCV